jgi:glycerol-3-phosphate cytidylyltransferase
MILLTLGTFDLYHSGHVALFRRCRDLSLGGSVVVGLNTDAFVQRYKGLAPVITYADREACIASCRFVDAVVPNEQSDGTARDVIEAVCPDIIAIGWDWRDRDYLGQLGINQDYLDAGGIRVVYLPYTPGAAGPSSAIKRRIQGSVA